MKLRNAKDRSTVLFSLKTKNKWEVVRKEKGKALCTSLSSGRSQWFSLSKIVYP